MDTLSTEWGLCGMVVALPSLANHNSLPSLLPFPSFKVFCFILRFIISSWWYFPQIWFAVAISLLFGQRHTLVKSSRHWLKVICTLCHYMLKQWIALKARSDGGLWVATQTPKKREQSGVRIKTTRRQYSPVPLEQARSVNSVLYGICTKLVYF